MTTKVFKIWLCLVLVASLCGCRDPNSESAFRQNDEIDRLVVLVLDLSGSFEHKMQKDGIAYKFALDVVDQCFRDSIGSEDRLILSQISGSSAPILWEGKPLDLRNQFKTPEEFWTFLKTKAVPNQSNVHDGIYRVVDYLMSRPGIANGRTKSAVLVLSDLLDNGASSSFSQMRDTLKVYGSMNGVVGLYYVDQNMQKLWHNLLMQTAIRDFVVEGDFYGKPNLPTLE